MMVHYARGSLTSVNIKEEKQLGGFFGTHLDSSLYLVVTSAWTLAVSLSLSLPVLSHCCTHPSECIWINCTSRFWKKPYVWRHPVVGGIFFAFKDRSGIFAMFVAMFFFPDCVLIKTSCTKLRVTSCFILWFILYTSTSSNCNLHKKSARLLCCKD